jgi:hypothetical protein
VWTQHVQHGVDGLGIGIVAVVPDDDAVVLQALAAHLADGEGGHGIAQALQRDLKRARHGHARQQVEHAVAAGQSRVEIDAIHAETRAFGERAMSVARTSAAPERPNVMVRPG